MNVTKNLSLTYLKKVHTETRDFGAAAIIDNKPRTARVITVTDCDFATVSMNDFKNCLAKFT